MKDRTKSLLVIFCLFLFQAEAYANELPASIVSGASHILSALSSSSPAWQCNIPPRVAELSGTLNYRITVRGNL